MSNVVVIKVKRSRVGAAIPFDKLYLFRKDDEALIPSIFQYAIVFPVTESLIDTLKELEPVKFSHIKHRRDDDALGQPVKLTGTKMQQNWWQQEIVDKYDLINRIIVIPVLTSNIKDRISPKYLASPYWNLRRTNGRRRRYVPVVHNKGPAISEFAYLSTPLPEPHDRISPICSICPRQLLQLQGECQPGERVCMETLNFNAVTEVRSVDEYVEEENPFNPADFEENG